MHRTPVDQPVAFVEIPRGTRNKYEYDERFGRVVLDRTLKTSMVYPAEYGFLLDTLAPDGDPVDCLVLTTEATFPGCLIPCDPVAVLAMHDEKGEDFKVVCVPHDDPAWSGITDIAGLRPELVDEIRHFFEVYKDLDADRHVELGDWGGAEQAIAYYRAGHAAFLAAQA
jgi:inorganic pyrophosphatase